MPYTICVNKPGCLPEANPCAVATLEEARYAAAEELARANSADEGTGESTAFTPHERAVVDSAIWANGGTVRLPDGYVIDVTYVTWDELAALAGITGDYARPEPEDMDEILHIYNHQGD